MLPSRDNFNKYNSKNDNDNYAIIIMITKRREASTWKAASADTAMFGSLQSCIKSKN